MYCSGCGLAVAPGQSFCPQCGRPMAAPIPSVPGLHFLLDSYAGKVRALSIAWFVWAGISLLFGFVGLNIARGFLLGHTPWMNGPGPGPWFGPAILHFAWLFIIVRAGLALAAGWGLMERTQWGRVIAIVAAVFSLLKFPFGTALGIWTLVTLLGYRNTSLYEQLPQL
jgi:hypothetical protein